MIALRTVGRAAVAVLALFVALSAASADYRVSARVQPDQGVGVDDTLRLVVQVEGTQNPQIQTPRLPKMTNLRVVGGPSTSMRSVWSNGQLALTSQLIYSLRPEGPGPAEVPPIELQIGTATFRTETIRFDVGQGRGAAPRPSAPAPQRRDRDADADVFLRADLGAEEVWVGQAVPLTVSIFTAEQVSAPQWVERPGLGNFWVEDLEVDPDSESYQSTVAGRRYTVYPIQRQVLVPQTAGEFELDPFVIRIDVRQRRRGSDPLEFFGFGRTRPLQRKSDPLKLRVKPLPSGGRPEFFGGAVGSFTLKVELDRTEASVNDAVALRATVEGKGLLRAVAAPAVEFPQDLKVFDPKTTSSTRRLRGELISRKTWEWILVPLVQGDLKLPPVVFPYFDPIEGRYRSASAAPPLVAVGRAGPADEGRLHRGEIQVQRRDLQFIKPLRRDLRQHSPRAQERTLYVVLLCLPLAWAPLLVLVGRQRARLQRNRGLARSRRARSRARRRLRAAHRRLGDADGVAFHEELARTLVEYVADRFDRAAAGLTYELADELLAGRGIDADLRRRFRALLETCDFARYVPAGSAADRRTELHGEAGELLAELERAL